MKIWTVKHTGYHGIREGCVEMVNWREKENEAPIGRGEVVRNGESSFWTSGDSPEVHHRMMLPDKSSLDVPRLVEEEWKTIMVQIGSTSRHEVCCDCRNSCKSAAVGVPELSRMACGATKDRFFGTEKLASAG